MAWMDLHLGTGSSLPPRVDAEPPPVPPVVFVADGDAAVRGALEQLGGAEGWRVEAFRSAAEFLAGLSVRTPACVVLDAALPGAGGLEMQQRLSGRPELPVIFAGDGSDLRLAVSAMKAGAVEFLVKPLSSGPLLEALREALERSRAALARLAGLETLRARYLTLSSREREVMALVVCGRLNKQAAAELQISEITVKAHRGKMMRKMGARSVPELVNMAARLFPVA
jgi:FixJ family two-component response regulator